MGRFAQKQKPPDLGTPSRVSQPGAPSAARAARPAVLQSPLMDRSQQTPTLTPLAEYLLREEHPLSRESPRLPYSLPLQPVARQAPTPLRAEPAGTAHTEAEVEAADRAAEEAARKLPGNGIIQRAPLPGTPPDRPEPPTKIAGPAPKPGAPGKIGDRVSILHARAAEIERKMRVFGEQKEWRAGFHAYIEQRWRVIREANDEYVKAEKQLDEMRDKFYIFEHESTQRTIESVERLRQLILQAGEETRNMEEPEKKYELETQKTEQALLREQRSISSAIQASEKAGAVLSQSQYESLASRLNQLRVGIDKLSDAELRVQVKYTGSGPGSRAQ